MNNQLDEDFTDQLALIPPDSEVNTEEARPSKRRRRLRSKPLEDELEIITDPRKDNLDPVELNIPSPDLLKGIHSLAAEYYSTYGQLRNHDRPDLKKRYMSPKKKAKSEEGQREEGQHDWQPNMFKAFDGTLLLCMGMLLQEHVHQQISSDPMTSDSSSSSPPPSS